MIIDGAEEVSSSEYGQLHKLKMLKIFKFRYHDNGYFNNRKYVKLNESISLIRSESLSELVLYLTKRSLSLSNPALSQLGVNVPYLKKLEINMEASINVLNTIIQNLPIEDLAFIGLSYRSEDRYFYQDGLSNEKLKKLSVDLQNCNIDDLPKLVGCCKSLKTLEIESQLKISPNFVRGLKEYGRNLCYFSCGAKGKEQKQMIKTAFEGIFTTIEEDFSGSLIMKK